jgi:hypothetical protein
MLNLLIRKCKQLKKHEIQQNEHDEGEWIRKAENLVDFWCSADFIVIFVVLWSVADVSKYCENKNKSYIFFT